MVILSLKLKTYLLGCLEARMASEVAKIHSHFHCPCRRRYIGPLPQTSPKIFHTTIHRLDQALLNIQDCLQIGVPVLNCSRIPLFYSIIPMYSIGVSIVRLCPVISIPRAHLFRFRVYGDDDGLIMETKEKTLTSILH